ncbi:MAG: hypothetical protein QE570_01020 [Verrucomicrobiota bacterium]|nr:hypothetical protein [Verrucomicrobiota bacterium]
MPRASTASQIRKLPDTISGLWALSALTPFRSRAAYEEAASLCNRFAVRRLNVVQREYFHELLELVGDYEAEHGEEAKTLRELKRLATRRTTSAH